MIAEFLAASSQVVTLTGTAGWEPLIGNGTAAGQTVTTEKALGLSAVFACVNNVAQDVAKLPIKVMQRRQDRGKDERPQHIAAPLVAESPNGELMPYNYKHLAMTHLLGWGNHYGHITRDARGRPRRIDPVHPSRCTVKRINGQVIYCVRDSGSITEIPIAARDMIHLRGFGDELQGWSVLAILAQSIGAALAKQEFVGSFFGNNLQTGLIATTPKQLNEKAAERLKAQLKANLGGANKFNFLLLEEDTKLQQSACNPDDAQLLESQLFSIDEVARAFRMPPHKIQKMTDATYSNIGEQRLEYSGDAIMPWVMVWEQELAYKLFTPAERADGYFMDINMDAILRADSGARGEFHRTIFNMGARSQNEIRKMEGENPISAPWANNYYMQTAMATVESIAAGAVGANSGSQPSSIAAALPSTEVTAEGEPGRDVLAVVWDNLAGSTIESARTLRPVILEACQRINAKETKAAESSRAKRDYGEWAADFYGEHFRIFMAQQLASLCEIIHPDNGRGICSTFIRDYCKAGPAVAPTSPDEMTTELIERLTNG